MGEIQIKDTGIYSVGGSIVSGEKQAFGDSGAGTALTLQGVTVTCGQATMTNDDTPISRKVDNDDTEAFTFGEADTNGIQNPNWSITGYCLRTSETDMITLGRLIYMCKTKGYKELYSSSENGFYDIIAYAKYGEREVAGESTKTVTYVNVRMKSISVTQTANKQGFKYVLSLVETN